MWWIILVTALIILLVSSAFYALHLYVPQPPRIKKNKKYIACIGDSITYGAGVILTKDFHSYPALLQKLVGKDYQVINYGYSGRTLLSSGDHPYVKEKQYQASINLNGDVYLIMLGTNDSKPHNWNKGRYESELKDLIKSYKNLPNKPNVIVMIPPKAFPVKGMIKFDINDEIIKNEMIPTIRKVANESDIKTVDLYSLTENSPELFIDGVHPNKKGNILISNYIYEEIKKFVANSIE